MISYMISIVNRSLEGEVKLLPDVARLKIFNFMLVSLFAKYDLYTDVIFNLILWRVAHSSSYSPES